MSVDLPSMFMGAAIAFGFSVLLLFVTRALRHSGEIQFKADDWEFNYARDYTDDEGYDRVAVIAPTDKEIDNAVRAEYSFTADFFNVKDISVALRDVKVVFLLKDREKLFDRPLDAEEHEQLPASSHRLGGWKEVGTIRLPSREPVIVKMKGTIADAHKLDELITGCDEVRLRATREDTSPFEKHMAWITTTFRTT